MKRTNKKCNIPGCDNPHYAKDMCKKCYDREYYKKRPKRILTFAQILRQKIYAQSEGGHATQKRYRGTLLFAQAQQRYNSTAKGKASKQRYTHSDKNKKAQLRWYVKNPHKRHATTIVRRALKAGKLVRPETCEFCDDFPSTAHHPNYDKPLEVIWVCGDHHRFIHANLY